MTGMIASLPRLPRFQFSLWALFAVVTVFAVVCWVVVDRQQLVRERDEAVEQARSARRDAATAIMKVERQTALRDLLAKEKAAREAAAREEAIFNK